MKVRKLDSGGDMMLGHGLSDFFQDSPEGVAQNVMTRLKLWRGQWFLDTNDGTPWLQDILGKHEAVDMIIRNRILGTPGVKEITEFQSVLDPDTRTLSIKVTIDTNYGSTEISETL